MAVITTTAIAAVTYQPYAGIPDIDAAFTSIPRGHIDVSVESFAIALVGAGDTQLLRLSVDLPRNFAYSLVNVATSIRNNTLLTVKFEDNATLKLENASGAARTIVYDVPMTALGVATAGPTPLGLKIWGPTAPVPNLVLKPATSVSQVRMSYQVNNGTDNDVAHQFNFYAKFLQFDIEQTLHYAPNAPIPVR